MRSGSGIRFGRVGLGTSSSRGTRSTLPSATSPSAWSARLWASMRDCFCGRRAWLKCGTTHALVTRILTVLTTEMIPSISFGSNRRPLLPEALCEVTRSSYVVVPPCEARQGCLGPRGAPGRRVARRVRPEGQADEAPVEKTYPSPRGDEGGSCGDARRSDDLGPRRTSSFG